MDGAAEIDAPAKEFRVGRRSNHSFKADRFGVFGFGQVS